MKYILYEPSKVTKPYEEGKYVVAYEDGGQEDLDFYKRRGNGDITFTVEGVSASSPVVIQSKCLPIVSEGLYQWKRIDNDSVGAVYMITNERYPEASAENHIIPVGYLFADIESLNYDGTHSDEYIIKYDAEADNLYKTTEFYENEPDTEEYYHYYGIYEHYTTSSTTITSDGQYTINCFGGFGVTSGQDKITGIDFSKFDGYELTSIARLFRDMSNLSKIDMSGLDLTNENNEISPYAFYGCISLEEILLPRINVVHEYAFNDCTKLKSIDLPYCTSLYPESFYYCTSLREFSAPICEEILDGTFLRCTSLSKVSFDKCKVVGVNAFSNCTSLEELSLKSCTDLEKYALSSCKSLKRLFLPNCSGITKDSIVSCSALTDVNLDSLSALTKDMSTAINSVVTLSVNGANAVEGNCTMPNLEYISLNSCTSVAKWAFWACRKLKHIDLPKVETIGVQAFAHCSLLEELYIPEFTTSIDYGITYDCNSLSKLSVSSKNTKYDSRNNCNCIFETSTDTLIAGSPVSDFPVETKKIGEEAFFNIKLKNGNINLPNCESVEDTAFYLASGLTSFSSSSCLAVKEYSFEGSDIVKVDLPNCTGVGINAFSECTKLKSVNIPLCKSLNYGFNLCSSLESANFPNCTELGSKSFYKCTNLQEVNLPKCQKVYDLALSYCGLLVEVSLPECTFLDYQAMINNDNLTKVYIPKCSSIGNRALAGNQALRLVDLSGVSSIPSLGTNAIDTALLSSDLKIIIPKGKLSEWSQNASWSTWKDHLEEAE